MSEPLRRADVRKFDQRVATALLSITSDLGVKHRVIDGGHVLLYPPDGVTRPFKVSASRRAESTLRFLHGFIEEHFDEEAGR